MTASDIGPLVASGLCLAIPVVFSLAALARQRFAVSASALVLAMAVGVSLMLASGVVAGNAARLGVRLDVVTCVMLLVVCGIGLVIVRYSRTYLHGDPQLASYFRWLLFTLSAVTTLVIANNLLVIAAAWTTTSLVLHQLLAFYPERPAALVAAHKKFIVSRLADVCFWSSLVLVQLSVGSLNLDRLAAWASAHPVLTPPMHLAAVLAVIAVALKSAQLPFHGWLTQVMEAPTPVSALLHAGVVNMGGFVMIRLAPWMVHVPAAQLLLVVIGLITVMVAALVMTTRVTVKVSLAWSTCAQMGFMLVQCGLGAWHLALLHLVAHSFYKAHTFLSAGNAVDGWRVQQLSKPQPRPALRHVGVAIFSAFCGGAVGLTALQRLGAVSPDPNFGVWVFAVVVALSVVPMLVRRTSGEVATLALGGVSAFAIALLYFGWHAVATYLQPDLAALSAAPPLAWQLVGSGLVVLFVVKTALALWPTSRLARAMYPPLFAGLYLDEYFTRLTFRVWPPRIQRITPPAISLQIVKEAQS